MEKTWACVLGDKFICPEALEENTYYYWQDTEWQHDTRFFFTKDSELPSKSIWYWVHPILVATHCVGITIWEYFLPSCSIHHLHNHKEQIKVSSYRWNKGLQYLHFTRNNKNIRQHPDGDNSDKVTWSGSSKQKINK